MCLLCEGWTVEQVTERYISMIEQDGYVMIGFEAPTPWVYTIGLSWRFDHPELIVSNPVMDKASDLVAHAADAVVEGQRFDEDSVFVTPCGGLAYFGAVHPGNLSDEWFTWWGRVADAACQPPKPAAALQGIHACECPSCSRQVLLDRRRHPWMAPVGRRRRRRQR